MLVTAISKQGISPVRAVRIGALVMIAIILATSIGAMHHLYHQAFADAQRGLTTLDKLLAEQTNQAFMSAGLLQENIADDLYGAGLSGPEDLATLGGSRDMHDRLRQWIGGMPQVSSVGLVAADGKLVNLSRPWPVPPVNLRDRDYFKRLSAQGAPLTVLGDPEQYFGTPSWSFILGRRLNGDAHSFAGIVVVGLNTSYFEQVYRAMNLRPGSSVGLWRDDGLPLAHYPLGDGVDQPTSVDWGFAHLQPGESRILRVKEGRDQPRVVAVTRLTDEPVVVAVGRSDRAIRERALTGIISVGAACLACLVGVVLTTRLLVRQFNMYEAAAATARKQQEADRSMREAEAMLLRGQKLEAVGRLTAGVAHDFNNLLTVVRANAEMLNQAAENPKVARRLSAICQAADRGSVLTRQMLAFSRQQILTPASLDLRHTLGSISELLRASVGAQIRLETLFDDGLWPAYADAAQLEQAVLNLVFNARDAIEKDGSITIESRNIALKDNNAASLAAGDYVAVMVADTGMGMSDQIISQAFDPFFTTKKQGKGTGLGLSQVIGFARQSNGDVQLDSIIGRGTTVKIILPRAVA